MAPSAISSPPCEMVNTTSKLTKFGTNNTMPKTTTNHPSVPPAITPLSASNLIVTRTTTPKTVPTAGSPEVASQKCATDHMLTSSWNVETGWSAPAIRPFGPLSLLPTSSCLHYATECFEGMKAYRGHDGKLRLFRPQRNCARMLKSATRIALPGFEPDELQKLIEKFVSIEGPRWLPKDTHKGQFLYIRPTMIGVGEALGVQIPTEVMLFVIAVCFPEMDKPEGPLPVENGASAPSLPNGVPGGTSKELTWERRKAARGMRLLASRHDMIRAWPGGFGNAKVGANYGPSLIAQQEARERGYNQILWLFGEDCYVTEAGASNFFIVWRSKEGKTQLVTAPLGEGVILDGVTRQSVLDTVREQMEWELEVVERKFTMGEVAQAADEGRLIEAFGSGTAFFIAPVADIHFRGKDIDLPLAHGVEPRFALQIKKWIKGIMFGEVQHPWGVVVEEDEAENGTSSSDALERANEWLH